MKRAQRWLFCALAALVMMTAVSSLLAGRERPSQGAPRPASAVSFRLVA